MAFVYSVLIIALIALAAIVADSYVGLSRMFGGTAVAAAA